MSLSPTRIVLGAAGVLLGLYGGWLLLSRASWPDVLDAALWLAGGVVLHDFVLAPLVLLLGLAARGLPAAHRRAAVVALVVVGSLSLLAVPVLTRLGARPDNPTLLDRPYAWSWLVVLVATVLAVVVAGRLGSRRETGGTGETPGPDQR